VCKSNLDRPHKRHKKDTSGCVEPGMMLTCIAHVCRDNPCIMDYIQLKHTVMELDKHANDWKRKIELLQMEHKRTRQVLKSLTAVGGGYGATQQTGGSMVSGGVSHASGLGRQVSNRSMKS
jgi:hypothetical protein